MEKQNFFFSLIDMNKILIISLLCFGFSRANAAIDLVVINHSLGTSNIMAGNSLIVYASERNLGSTNAGANVISVHLSANTVLTPGANGDIWIGDIVISNCPANSTTSIYNTTTIILPNTLASGTYYIFFSADGGQVITETNETNNFAYLQINITACSMATPSSLTPGGSSGSPATVSTTTPLLQWAAVPNATCYGVYIRNVVNNALIYNNDAATTTNSFTVPAGLLSIGGQYKWNNLAKSTCSNSSCLSGGATTVYFNVGCTLPPAPTGFTATAVSSSQIDLSWNSVSGATRYEVNYAQGSCPWGAGGQNLTTTNCNTCTTASAPGLSPNTTYRFIVIAYNACGWGTTYSCANATTFSNCSPPPAPTLNSPTVISSSQINLSWNNTGATNYDVYYTTGNCPWSTGNLYTNTNGTSVAVTGLSQTTTYKFVIVAKNSPTCVSVNSNCHSATTQSQNPVNYNVSGTITYNGNGLNGATLTASPGGYSVSTNSSGNYSLSLPSGWTGTVTPGLVNYSFTPANKAYNNLAANQPGQNYTATNTSIPAVNSITFTNKIENHAGITPLHTLYTGLANVTNDPVKICADGSTSTFIKVNVSNTAGVSFRILDGNNNPINDIEKYGLLGSLNIFGNNVEVSYTHPQYMDAVGVSRQLKLEVLYNQIPINGINFPLHIYRAPILMVHGLWGDYSSFEKCESELINSNLYPGSFLFVLTGTGSIPIINESTNFLTQRADYESSHGKDFNSNAGVIPLWSKILFNKSRVGNYSCGKFDLICHSMGGLLGRLYISNKYGNYKNDVHKFITLNTPHRGTQVANYLDRDSWYTNSLKATLKKLFGWRSDQGAIQDLRVESTSMLYLNSTESAYHFNPPVHTISTKDFSLLDPMGIAVQDLLGYAILHHNIYNSDLSDLIVPLSSQKAGLSLSATVPNQFHVGSSKNSNVQAILKELLNSSPSNTSHFSQNGITPAVLTPPVFDKPLNPSNGSLTNDSIYFVTPTNNQIFSVGSNVSINIQSVGNISKILFAAGNQNIDVTTIYSETSQLVTVYTIPSEAIGRIFLTVYGGDSTGYRVIDTIQINITSPVVIDSIFSIPQSLSLPIGFTASLTIKGLFNDGIVRDISDLPELLFSGDTSIVKHIGNSVLIGTGEGNTPITFSYQNKSTQINLHVFADTSLLNAGFGSDKIQVCPSDSISFKDQSTSIPTSLLWQFPGGTPSTSTLPNPVITYNIPGNYNVVLVASYPGKTDTLLMSNYITVNQKNKTISSGNWEDPLIWTCGVIPSVTDSVVVSSNHNIILNSSSQVRKLVLEENSSIFLNNPAVEFTIGADSNKTSPLICNGSLNMASGIIKINGNLSITNTGQFNMTGGKLILDGNTGQSSTSIPDGQHLFNVSTTPGNFNFTGGTLQIINPPLGVNSQAINCSYDFSPASTVIFGDGVSTIASDNPNGFGGYLLPAQIGKLIFDPATTQNNRVFKNLNPLVIRTSCEVRSGNLVQGALLQVIDSLALLDIDGNIYPVINICDKQWTAKNLEVTHYRNGDTIPQVQDPVAWSNLTTGAWCYYQNNTANEPVYGKLYNWYAVNDPRGLAPTGWHIPANAEWQNLADTCLGGFPIAAGKMKTTGTLLAGTGLWGGSTNTSTNSSGFSGVPSGYCFTNGTFANLGAAAFWWSTTQSTASNAWYYEADQEAEELSSSTYSKKLGISVRCVKD